LLQILRQSNDIAYAYIFNGQLSPLEFLQYIASDYGLPASGKNKSEILFDLSNYMIARGTRKLTTVLIVDEAHHLSVAILEEIRLLTNLETPQDKLLQVLLVGQPELDEKLDSAEMRQLKQRIAHRCQLGPLDLNETSGYIKRRLHLAGLNANSHPLFPPDAVASVYRHSRGIPRLINTICDNALITAYSRRLRTVTSDIIDGSAADLRLNVSGTPSSNEKHAGEPDEVDIRRAARSLLDLYAYLNRLPSSERETPGPAATYSEQV
jgi:general secretion pathway protein A